MLRVSALFLAVALLRLMFFWLATKEQLVIQAHMHVYLVLINKTKWIMQIVKVGIAANLEFEFLQHRYF